MSAGGRLHSVPNLAEPIFGTDPVVHSVHNVACVANSDSVIGGHGSDGDGEDVESRGGGQESGSRLRMRLARCG